MKISDLLSKNIYDERQLRISADAYKHGYIVTAITLALNALLNRLDISWANVPWQNIIILTFITTTITVEIILRGAFFGKNKKPVLILMAASALIGFALSFVLRIMFVRNDSDLQGADFAHETLGALVSDGTLTDLGSTTVVMAMISVIAAAGFIKYIHNKIKEKEKE
ncbi:MAG: hypothetical protein FWH08_03430 [Oscillospiraceae bacterium]|nr:hypothetical protein [Oscillospiraceae bacterium]